jgi:hypothetical protein
MRDKPRQFMWYSGWTTGISFSVYVTCLSLATAQTIGRDSVVGIAARYALDVPGIESKWRRDIRHPSGPALGSTQSPVQGVPPFFPVVKLPWRGLDHPPSSSAEFKERVDLYLYSQSRLSWHVLGWTSSFLPLLSTVTLEFTYKLRNELNVFASDLEWLDLDRIQETSITVLTFLLL